MLSIICFTLFLLPAVVHSEDIYNEELYIKPLAPSHVYTFFQFVTLVDSESTFQHPHLAPRSLGEIISRFQVEELHLTLTQGQWRHKQWGYPVLDAAAGAELYAWFAPEVRDIDVQWEKLTKTLAGLFCASLNFMEKCHTARPKMALWPTGAMKQHSETSNTLRYASLPKEIVCTENLTPWKKLLPCESSHGFAALFNSRMMHNTNYHSLGVHVRRVCTSTDCLQTRVEIKLTVALVYDYQIIGSADWSFRRLFGQGLPGACSLSTASRVYVDITSNGTQPFKLVPPPDTTVVSKRGANEVLLAVYDIPANGQMINIGVKHEPHNNLAVVTAPPLHFNRYVLGYGKEHGGIVTELTNSAWSPINVVLFENAPWWLPIQLSTLRINGKPKSNIVISQYYSPGKSRQKPYHLELLLNLPPRSTTTITIDFEFIFMKWQEYPPDANHGFYIGSALIAANLRTARNYTSLPLEGSTFESLLNASRSSYPIVFRTNGATVSLPTPDFSMPYNVICLACTVVALAFGPLHNICTKQLVLKPFGTPTTIRQKVVKLLSIIRSQKTE